MAGTAGLTKTMLGYVLRRLGQAVFVLWAAFTVTWLILYQLPGDPVAIMLDMRGEGQLADTDQIDKVRKEFGLDRPLIVQYLSHLSDVLAGNFGRSIQSGKPVIADIALALPATLQLAGFALVLAVLLGAGLAVVATFVRGGAYRAFLLSLPPLGVSVPTFWIGLMLMQVLSFRWHLFPAMGNDGFRALVLPALTLAIPTSAGFAQVLARSIETVQAQAYVETALAKGASHIRVHLVHVVRNAMIPGLTLVGLSAGGLLGGSVVTEVVFSRQGIGRLTEIAVHAQDIQMVEALVLISTLIFVVVNLMIDLLYPLLDPRITYTTPRQRGQVTP